MASNFENDSPVMRSVMANTTADGKDSFRTSVFGFNKEAVMDYVDRLYSEYSREERRLHEELSKVKQEKDDLQQQVKSLDSQYEALQSKVKEELGFVSSYHEQEQYMHRTGPL